MIKGALCTAEIKGVCEAGLVVEAAVVRALVRGCSDVAAVGDASAPCLLLGQDRSSGALEAAGEGAEEHKRLKKECQSEWKTLNLQCFFFILF